MSLDTLNDLLVENLRDLLNAERQLVTALPKMAKGASSPELEEAFRSHLEETRTHVTRLERALESLDGPTVGKLCKGMEGLIEEGTEVLEEDGEETVKDAGLIAAAQKVEHYEIAGYGSCIAYARILGKEDVAALLGQTLDEEKAADDKLTALAESNINARAAEADDDAMDDDDVEEEATAKVKAEGGRRKKDR